MRLAQALAIDVVAVLFFALVGRRAHAETSDVLGVLQTAWPFLAGLLIGILLARAWRSPLTTRTGVIIWLSTLVAGIGLRLLSGTTAQLPFVIVAAIVLGLLLLGWRLVARAVHRARHRIEKQTRSGDSAQQT